MHESRYAFGTLEEARQLIGRDFISRTGSIAVSGALIRLFCSVTEDANPSYWNLDSPLRNGAGSSLRQPCS